MLVNHWMNSIIDLIWKWVHSHIPAYDISLLDRELTRLGAYIFSGCVVWPHVFICFLHFIEFTSLQLSLSGYAMSKCPWVCLFLWRGGVGFFVFWCGLQPFISWVLLADFSALLVFTLILFCCLYIIWSTLLFLKNINNF